MNHCWLYAGCVRVKQESYGIVFFPKTLKSKKVGCWNTKIWLVCRASWGVLLITQSCRVPKLTYTNASCRKPGKTPMTKASVLFYTQKASMTIQGEGG